MQADVISSSKTDSNTFMHQVVWINSSASFSSPLLPSLNSCSEGFGAVGYVKHLETVWIVIDAI